MLLSSRIDRTRRIAAFMGVRFNHELSMRRITRHNFKQDQYYPSVVRAVTACVAGGDVVTTIDVFVKMNLLRKEDVEGWRFGRVPYLEKVILCNVEKAERILRILRYHAAESRLQPSWTAYKKWGGGQKRPLRFSKTALERLEEAYSTHYLRPRRAQPLDGPAGESVVESSAAQL